MVEALVLVVLVYPCILVEDILELPSLQFPTMFLRCLRSTHTMSPGRTHLEYHPPGVFRPGEVWYPEYDQPGVPESTDLESSHQEYWLMAGRSAETKMTFTQLAGANQIV